MGFFERTIKALNDAEIPNIVAGDLAVVLHGYVRVMPALDLRVHVRVDDARTAARTLGVSSPQGASSPLTLVTHEQAEFVDLLAHSVVLLLESTTVRLVSIEDLIERKRREGGRYDLLDADALEAIQLEMDGRSPPTRDGWEEHHQQRIRDLLLTTPARRLRAFEELIDFSRGVEARRRKDGRIGAKPSPRG